MVASDSRTPFTSLRVSFPSFSSANLEIRSDFDSGLPIRSISSGLPAGPGKSSGIVGETRGSWKRKGPGISEQGWGLAFGIEPDGQRIIPIGEDAGVQGKSVIGHDQQIERAGSPGTLNLERRDPQVLAAPKDVRFPVPVDGEPDGDLGERPAGRRRGLPIVVVVDRGGRDGPRSGAPGPRRGRFPCAPSRSTPPTPEQERESQPAPGGEIEGGATGHGLSPPARASGEFETLGGGEAYFTPGLGT